MAYTQEIRLLAIAEQSKNPAIQAYALEAAKQEREGMQRQEARITSRSALAISALCVIAAALVSLYARLFYTGNMASSICWIAFGSAVLICILCFVFTDRLEALAAVQAIERFVGRFLPKP